MLLHKMAVATAAASDRADGSSVSGPLSSGGSRWDGWPLTMYMLISDVELRVAIGPVDMSIRNVVVRVAARPVCVPIADVVAGVHVLCLCNNFNRDYGKSQ